jgi:hypothetical protein
VAAPTARRCAHCRRQKGVTFYALQTLDGSMRSVAAHPRCFVKLRAAVEARRRAALVCPSCGGSLELVTDGAVERVYVAGGFQVIGRELPRRVEALPFLACSACEYCALVPR